MCRTAGRRCPSTYDPAAREARNARRRDAYATRKAAARGQKVSPEKTMESVAAGALAGSSRIGVQSAPVPAKHHYHTHLVQGVINYKNLDENSYKEFGFEYPTEENPLYERRTSDEGYSLGRYTQEASEEEMAFLSPLGKNCLNYYTQSHYRWINEHAYHPENVELLPTTSPEDEEKAERLFVKGTTSLATHNRATLKQVMRGLDEALAQGPKKQRVVYRGISTADMRAANPQVKNRASEEEVLQWVDEHRSLGTEVVFDGYTSTSVRPSVAGTFSEDGGMRHHVVYEILTPEGACISAVSDNRLEDEVLLPRKQRYTVVGVHKDKKFREGQRGTIIQLVAINSKGEILDGTNADPIEPLL